MGGGYYHTIEDNIFTISPPVTGRMRDNILADILTSRQEDRGKLDPEDYYELERIQWSYFS
jgi:hypothetical protein